MHFDRGPGSSSFDEGIDVVSLGVEAANWRKRRRFLQFLSVFGVEQRQLMCW
jgi:hypothetical protein